MKVRLKVDLTKYHSTLEVGVEGTIVGAQGRQAREMPKTWVTVRFEKHTLDVLRKHIEIIRAVDKREGPVLTIQSPTPPKIGDVVEFAGAQFVVKGLVERVGEDLWRLSLRAG